jgi:uncharacterized protein (DUF952 family)
VDLREPHAVHPQALDQALSTTIFHITERPLWDAARGVGRYDWSTRGATLAEVGFIHCSFREQLEKVAGFLYADFTDELVVLEIDSDRIGAPIRVENLDGGDELFPHIYGPLDVDAVVDVLRLRRDSGRWRLTDPT